MGQAQSAGSDAVVHEHDDDVEVAHAEAEVARLRRRGEALTRELTKRVQRKIDRATQVTALAKRIGPPIAAGLAFVSLTSLTAVLVTKLTRRLRAR